MIKVMIIDDSALIRQTLKSILEEDPQIQILSTAIDPLFAIKKIKAEKPDVITLDVEMPRMDGISFLKQLMRSNPIPTIMISSLTQKNADISLQALAIGAFDVLGKPDDIETLKFFGGEIIQKVKSAANAQVKSKLSSIYQTSILKAPATIPAREFNQVYKKKIIAIGSSTGGPQAIDTLITSLPTNIPGIVIAQHMPKTFTASFAKRLNSLFPHEISEAKDNIEITNGSIHIAPGDKHLIVEKRGSKYYTRLSDGPPVNGHKPSVSVLFNSITNHAGKEALGVMLTGMGKDGALAMANMRKNGAYNLTQDEQTCIVYGMPAQAVLAGASDLEVPLSRMAKEIIRGLKK